MGPGVRAGRWVVSAKGGCFVKVDFCNILKVAVLSRWVFWSKGSIHPILIWNIDVKPTLTEVATILDPGSLLMWSIPTSKRASFLFISLNQQMSHLHCVFGHAIFQVFLKTMFLSQCFLQLTCNVGRDVCSERLNIASRCTVTTHRPALTGVTLVWLK